MSAVAIIPARGGSKRLPRKNVVDFFGRPIIAYSIEAALSSACFERVVVSTEDGEIADVALSLGAEVAFRSERLASDHAKVADVCADLLRREEEAGRPYTHFSCLYPAAPLRNADDVKAVMRLVQDEGFDFALAVTSYDLSPHQALIRGTDQSVRPAFPELVAKRDEEVGEFVVDNGSTYAASVEAFLLVRSFYGPKLGCHYVPRSRSVDINTDEDLEIARYRYSRLQS